MKKLILLRENFLPKLTLGTLYVVDVSRDGNRIKRLAEFESLELPWKENRRNFSCIPAGTYIIKKRWSPKHRHHLHIKGVVGRTWILIHPGNKVKETRGCIFPGMRFGDLDSDGTIDILESRKALNEILQLIPEILQPMLAILRPTQRP